MYIDGKIDPLWNISDFYKLEYKLDYHKDLALIEKYAHLGHPIKSMSVYNCFDDKIDIDKSYILEKFNFLNHLSIAINLFKPGQYLPCHRDLYQRYKTVHGLESSENIYRIILMLENSSPGQILQIEDRAIAHWSAGNWYGWKDFDLHAFYNFSMENRYAVQITGTLN
jgi:hypothetical protein